MKIVWSHSRINTLMNNPAEYYLSYVEGITPKVEKTALSIGSAIHWGLEHETSDLTEYYNEKGNFRQWNNYTEEQCLAECIVEAFLKRKEEIYNQILTDEETNEKAEIIEIEKELMLTAHLNSNIYPDGHDFLGIIDLLFLTNKGFILLDYKTSSRDVDWESYKSQLFKYKLLLQATFPEIPLYKIGIINLQKTSIRRKKNESDIEFKNRIKQEYLIKNELINFHCYRSEEFSEKNSNKFNEDLASMIDVCRNIVERGSYYTNYSNIVGTYGPSQYYDVFYHKDDSHFMYIIKDTIFDEDENIVLDKRDCDPIDMLVLDNKNILNKYNLFKSEVSRITNGSSITKDTLFKELKKNWICSDDLLEKYYKTYQHNI